jgi:hypothetical protein
VTTAEGVPRPEGHKPPGRCRAVPSDGCGRQGPCTGVTNARRPGPGDGVAARGRAPRPPTGPRPRRAGAIAQHLMNHNSGADEGRGFGRTAASTFESWRMNPHDDIVLATASSEAWRVPTAGIPERQLVPSGSRPDRSGNHTTTSCWPSASRRGSARGQTSGSGSRERSHCAALPSSRVAESQSVGRGGSLPLRPPRRSTRVAVLETKRWLPGSPLLVHSRCSRWLARSLAPRSRAGVRKPSQTGSRKNASGPVRQRCLGARGRCFGKTNRSPCGRSDRSLPIRFFGGTACNRAGATQGRMRRNPSPTSPGLLRSVAFRWRAPPRFEARDVALATYPFLYPPEARDVTLTTYLFPLPRRSAPVKRLVRPGPECSVTRRFHCGQRADPGTVFASDVR